MNCKKCNQPMKEYLGLRESGWDCVNAECGKVSSPEEQRQNVMEEYYKDFLEYVKTTWPDTNAPAASEPDAKMGHGAIAQAIVDDKLTKISDIVDVKISFESETIPYRGCSFPRLSGEKLEPGDMVYQAADGTFKKMKGPLA